MMQLLRSQRFSRLISSSLLVLVICYFSFHLVSGDKGLLTLTQLSQRVENAKQMEDITSNEREKIQDRVNRLYAESLDLDLLDEQSRRILGRSGKNEIVYFYPKADY